MKSGLLFLGSREVVLCEAFLNELDLRKDGGVVKQELYEEKERVAVVGTLMIYPWKETVAKFMSLSVPSFSSSQAFTTLTVFS